MSYRYKDGILLKSPGFAHLFSREGLEYLCNDALPSLPSGQISPLIRLYGACECPRFRPGDPVFRVAL
jgi:hypothetical protein